MGAQLMSSLAWSRYVVAIALVALAAGLRIWPLQSLGLSLEWITFYPAVIIAALYGGFFAGLLATMLSVLTVIYLWPFFGAPPFSSDPAHQLGHYIFFLNGCLVSGLAELMRRTQARAIKAEMQSELANNSRILFENSPIGILAIDPNNERIIQANRVALNMWGYGEDEMLTKTIADMTYPDDLAESLQRNGQLSKGMVNSLRFEKRYLKKDGSYFWGESNVSTLKDSNGKVNRFIGSTIDITERKKAEITEKRLTRALTLLRKADSALIHSKNEQELLTEVCKLAVEAGGYLMSWVGYAEADAARSVRHVARSGYEEGYLESIKITWSDTKNGQGPTGTAIRDGVTVTVQDVQAEPKMAPWLEAATKRGYRSCIGLPLIINKQVLGALTIYSSEPSVFGTEEVKLLEELASDLSFGIQTLRSRAELEATLLHSQRVLDTAMDGSWLTDMQSNLLYANEVYANMSGYTVDELIKMHISQLDAIDQPQDVAARAEKIIRQGHDRFETRHRHKDGHLIDIEVSVTFMPEVQQFFVFSRDISERKLAEQQLRDLTAHIQSVREEEKIAIAREIHDDLGGTLTSLKLEAHSLKTEVSESKDTERLLGHINEMSQLIDHAVGISRQIITGLHPTILDDLGILAALEWKADQFMKLTGIECWINCVCSNCADCDVRMSKPLSITLFRITQEALTNVARHSGASRVEIEFHCGDDEVVLSIIDNGRGMMEGANDGSAHFGLLGIRERVHQLGGQLVLDTPPGGGVNVTVILPLFGD